METVRFSKKKFLETASPWTRKQLKDHLDIIDGMEVAFDGYAGEDGHIEQYFADGQEYYLCPVYREWCE